MSDAQRRVQAVLDQLTASGEERGLQVAAYLDGELVVDAWSGVADPATGRTVDGDILFTVFSIGKGIAATAVHMLVERGALDYDAPVCRVWPEFAANGKEAVTLRQVLCHQAGIPQVPDGATITDLRDWDSICAAIAALAPLWEPGTRTGYHATTWGFLVGEIVRRADGRPFDRFVREEICAPLGVDSLFYGIPDEAEPRVATLEDGPRPPEQPSPAPDTLGARVMGPVPRTAAVWNRADVRRACIPAAGGIMNARAIARHYAALVDDGVDGVRLLPPERVAAAATLQTDARDKVHGVPVPKALGYFLGGPLSPMGNRRSAFGHGGTGGSTGFADPEHRFAFALTKNRLVVAPPGDGAAIRVARETRAALGIPD